MYPVQNPPPIWTEVTRQSSSTTRRSAAAGRKGRMGSCAYQLVAEVDGGVLVAGLLPLGAAAVDADPPEPGPPLRAAVSTSSAARLRRRVRPRLNGGLLIRLGPGRRRWRRSHGDSRWGRGRGRGRRLQCNDNRRGRGHGDATRGCSGDRASSLWLVHVRVEVAAGG